MTNVSCVRRALISSRFNPFSLLLCFLVFLLPAGGLHTSAHALDLLWTGAGTLPTVWDKTSAGASSNWRQYPSGGNTTFVDGDTVYFGLPTNTTSYTITIDPAMGSYPGAVRVSGMTVDGSGNFTITGRIDDTTGGTLVKNGSGILTFGAGGAVRFNTVQVNAGILVANRDSLTTAVSGAAMNVAVNGTGALQFNAVAAENYGFSGIVTGAGTGGVVKTGAGTLTLTGDSTYTGGTKISDGTLQLGNGGTAGSIIGNVLNNSRLLFDRTGTYAFEGTVSGSGSLVKNNTGTVILNTANTYSGGTTINAGTLQIGDGGTTGSITGDVLNNGTLAFNRAGTYVYSGTVTGTGAVEKSGAGTVVLTGDSSYGGGTTIKAGTLQLGNNGASGSIAGNVLSNGTLAFNRANTYKFDGVISGSGAVVKDGTNTVILTGTNAYGGLTTINGGTLQLGEGKAGGSIIGNVLNNGTLTFNRSDNDTYAGVVSGSGGIVKTGTGTMELTGNNTYRGPTTVQDGTLRGNIAANTDLVVTNPGIYRSGGSSRTLNSLNGTGRVDMESQNLTVLTGDFSQGTLVNTGNLIKNGNGTFTVGAATVAGLSLNSGHLTVANGKTLTVTGTATIGSGAILGVGAYPALDANRLDIDPNAILDICGCSVAGTVITTKTLIANPFGKHYVGGVEVTDSVTIDQILNNITVTYNNNKAGGTDVVIGNGGLIWFNTSPGVPGVAHGTFKVESVFEVIQVLNDRAAGTFVGLNGWDGKSLTKNGAGTLILSNTNNYSGGTTINAGTLQLGNGGATGSIVGNVVNNGILAFNRSNAYQFAGAISGSGAVVKNEANTVTLTADNTYTGGTVINAGTLQLGAGGATGSIRGNVLNNGTLAVNRTGQVALDGVISGTGNVSLTGGATVIMTADNTYSGGTTINAGTLQLGNGGATGSVQGDILNNGTLDFNRSGTYTYNGVVSGTGGLVTNGSGTVVLNGVSNYGGTTQINHGTLAIGDADHLGAAITGTNPVTVASGGTLAGYGRVGGMVTVQSGGVISPGGADGTRGTLTLDNGITFASGSTYRYDVGITQDLIRVSAGTVTIQAGALLDARASFSRSKEGDLLVIAAADTQFAPGSEFTLANSWAMQYDQEIRTDGYYLTYARMASPSSVADGPNMQEISDALDWAESNNIDFTGELEEALTDMINAPTREEATQRLRELSPAVLAGGLELAPMVSRQFSHSLDGMWRRQWQEEEQQSAANNSDNALALWNPQANRVRFWAEGTGAWNDHDSPNGDPGYTAKEWAGTVAGYRDFGASGNWKTGVALNVNRTKMDWKYGLGTSTGDSFAGALIVSLDPGPWFVTGNLTLGTTDISSRRRLPLAGLKASADYRTNWYGADARAGYRLQVHGWSLTPSAGARWYQYDSQRAAEKGAGTAGLIMSRDRRKVMELNTRLDVTRSWCFANGLIVRPHGFVAMAAELGDQLSSPTMNFVGAPAGMTSFNGYSARNSRLSAQAGLGVDVRMKDRWTVYGEYVGEFGSRHQRHGGRLGVGLAF